MSEGKVTTRYVCHGEAYGRCAHLHRSVSGARRCLEAYERARHVHRDGFHDRRIMRLEGGRLDILKPDEVREAYG